MSVPQDPTKNHPASNNKEQKVIVLSMKNMPSFKFDVTKSLLASNQDNGQSVFSFKPQQLLQSPPSSSSHTLQVAQPKTNTTNIQVVSQPILTANSPVHHQKIQGTAGTILIRAQSPTTNIQKTQSNIIKPQQISLIQTSHPNIKIQDSSSTGLRKISPEITMKNQAGHTLLLHPTPTSTVKTQTVINQLQMPTQKKIIVSAQSSNQAKMFQIATNQRSLPKQHVKIVQSSLKESKPIPILPKPENTQKIVVQQHVILPSVIVQQSSSTGNQQVKPNVITIPVTASSLLKYSVPQSQQQVTTKWAIPSNVFPPALAPIQPKVSITQTTTSPEKNDSLKMLMEIDEIHENSSESENFNDNDENDDGVEVNEMENEEKTPEKVITKRCTTDDEQQFLNVKRIIEGDDDLHASEKTTESQNDEDNYDNDNGMNDLENISAEIKESFEQSKAITSTTTIITNNKQQSNNSNNNSNDSILLCDEQIANITPEESPENSDKPKDQITPMHTNEEVTVKIQSIEDVKKNLKLDLISSTSLAHDKNVVDQEEGESIINDDDHSNQSSMIGQKETNDDNESPKSKSEVLLDQASTSKSIKGNEGSKPKRNRKPKNPTVITSLGLPYKPPQPSSRKKKTDKKVELEMDFHDPLNKILWEDGIGGLNNCNKLFGFNEFGLIEVLSKKDATAKLKYDENPLTDDNFNFKFRKIVDPQNQFTCVICSKLGTIRDFFSPECCSESCFAITKRKTTEFNSSSKDDDSGQISPTDAKKVIYEGELISLNQLQQYLLEQQLPKTKRKHGTIKSNASAIIPEVKFSWESYLTAKSVPAPEDFFLYTAKTASNHFRVGMKLEAVDPKNQHLICVCSVEEKLGCRIKIHFDGYPSTYDFWTNSDSFNIFYVGFCQSTGRKLNVPQRWTNKKFDWTEYFDHTNSVGAQPYMFSRLNQSSNQTNPLTVGMKAEVKHGEFWYAATIIDVLNLRVLIRFDGIYEHFGCYWFDIYSPYLHPCNGHKTLEDQSLFKPPFMSTTKPFDWTEYIKSCNSIESPTDFLLNKTRKPYQFEPGMKLEIVDKVNPQLIRPATVLCRNEYKIQVIFDGFDIKYAYWLDDDSEDIHPINYCKLTEHPIEHPAGAHKFLDNSLCSMNGCRGIGNGLHSDRYFHDNLKECPYNIDNWNRLIDQRDNSRMDYKPYVRRNKSSVANENRSLLLQQHKYKKEKQEVEIKQEPVQINEDDTASSENVKIPKKRAKKRKIAQSVATEGNGEIAEEDGGERKVKIRVIKHFLEEYGPQLNYAYNLWTKNSKVLDKAMITDEDLSENPIKWNVDDVCTFLVKFCDEETTAKFYAQKVDGEAFLGLCQKDLVTLMDIKIGPAIKIYNRILWLRQEVMSKFTEF